MLYKQINDRVNWGGGSGPLLARPQQARHDFTTIEGFAPAVLLDNHVRYLIDALIRRKAPLASQAFPAAANCLALTRLARINHFVFKKAAEWTFHINLKG